MLLYESTFALHGADPADVVATCRRLAPDFAALPGLIHKVWTRDGSRYGGIYLWQDRASLEAFLGGPLAPASNPAFTDLRARTLDVLQEPTCVTTPMDRRLSAPA